MLGATWVSASPLGEAAAADAAIDAARLQDWVGYDVLDPGFDDATLTVSSPVGTPEEFGPTLGAQGALTVRSTPPRSGLYESWVRKFRWRRARGR